MNKFVFLALLVGAIAGSGITYVFGLSSPAAEETVPSQPATSGYEDLLETEIRGLTPEQIEGYRTAKGMGLALPAELNGYPGPRHILDFSEEIELSEEQHEQVQVLFDQMQAEAIPIGDQILIEEAALEMAFRESMIDEDYLETQLATIGDLQSELRYAHLRTHLAALEILTPHQVMIYNQLRGYEGTDGGHQHDESHLQG